MLKRSYFVIPLLIAFLIMLAGCGKKGPAELGIFSETYTNQMLLLNVNNPPDEMGGYLGTWQSDPKDITIAQIDTNVFYEGKQSLKVVNGQGPWGGGIWFQFGFDSNENPTKRSTDLSKFAKGNLVFWVKCTNDILIKLESENGGEDKAQLSSYNIKLDGTWQQVVIPISDLAKLDLKKLNVVFGAHYIPPLEKVTFWLDNIYLTKDSK